MSASKASTPSIHYCGPPPRCHRCAHRLFRGWRPLEAVPDFRELEVRIAMLPARQDRGDVFRSRRGLLSSEIEAIAGLIVRQQLSAIQHKRGGVAANSRRTLSRQTVIVLLYTKSSQKAQLLAAEVSVLFRSLRHKLDPLDREILERTFDATLAAVNGDDSPLDVDSDEGLEAILRRELIEIACFTGVSDPETLKDLLLARLPAGQTSTDGGVKASRRRKSLF